SYRPPNLGRFPWSMKTRRSRAASGWYPDLELGPGQRRQRPKRPVQRPDYVATYDPSLHRQPSWPCRKHGHLAFSGRLEKSITALRPVQTYIDNQAPGSEVELPW